jgi:hypothetical protein
MERDLDTVTFETPQRPDDASPAQAPAPLRFRVVDVMGARELARDIGAAAVVRLLEPMRSALDARLYVWMPGLGRWRLLTLDEHRLLWRFRRAQRS